MQAMARVEGVRGTDPGILGIFYISVLIPSNSEQPGVMIHFVPYGKALLDLDKPGYGIETVGRYEHPVTIFTAIQSARMFKRYNNHLGD